MSAVLEQLFLPPRLLLRAFDDLHRMADAAVSVAATMRLLREDAVGLREAFAGADAELEALRKAFVPEVEGIRGAAEALKEEVRSVRTLLGALDSDVKQIGKDLTSEMASFHATIQVLVREADEMRQVVEPLQSATERVGRVADKLPGGKS